MTEKKCVLYNKKIVTAFPTNICCTRTSSTFLWLCGVQMHFPVIMKLNEYLLWNSLNYMPCHVPRSRIWKIWSSLLYFPMSNFLLSKTHCSLLCGVVFQTCVHVSSYHALFPLLLFLHRFIGEWCPIQLLAVHHQWALGGSTTNLGKFLTPLSMMLDIILLWLSRAATQPTSGNNWSIESN